MVKTKVSKSGEITAYSEAAFRNNNAMIEYCRTSACALSGCTAGIMGLTGLQGFAFYFCAVLGLWCLLLLKAGPSWEKYFVNRVHLLTNGFFGGLFTYVLFWTYPLILNFVAHLSVFIVYFVKLYKKFVNSLSITQYDKFLNSLAKSLKSLQ